MKVNRYSNNSKLHETEWPVEVDKMNYQLDSKLFGGGYQYDSFTVNSHWDKTFRTARRLGWCRRTSPREPRAWFSNWVVSKARIYARTRCVCVEWLNIFCENKVDALNSCKLYLKLWNEIFWEGICIGVWHTFWVTVALNVHCVGISWLSFPARLQFCYMKCKNS